MIDSISQTKPTFFQVVRRYSIQEDTATYSQTSDSFFLRVRSPVIVHYLWAPLPAWAQGYY